MSLFYGTGLSTNSEKKGRQQKKRRTNEVIVILSAMKYGGSYLIKFIHKSINIYQSKEVIYESTFHI